MLSPHTVEGADIQLNACTCDMLWRRSPAVQNSHPIFVALSKMTSWSGERIVISLLVLVCFTIGETY